MDVMSIYSYDELRKVLKVMRQHKTIKDMSKVVEGQLNWIYYPQPLSQPSPLADISFILIAHPTTPGNM